MEYLSASRIKMLTECKRKFYYKYVLGEIEDDSSPHGDMGSAIHKVLEIYRESPHLTQRQLIGIFAKEFPKTPDTEYLFKEGCRIIWKMKPQQIFLGELVSVEKEFEETLGDITIRGIIDKIEMVNGIMVVTDYKTNKKIEPEKYHHQLAMYDLVLEKMYPGSVRRHELLYMRYGRSVDFSFTPEQREHMLNTLQNVSNYITENRDNPAEFPRIQKKEPMCRYCPLENSCW